MEDWETLRECPLEIIKDVTFHPSGNISILLNAGSLHVPSDICKDIPQIGEVVELVAHNGDGRLGGGTIYGIRIGGRIYRRPPDGCDWADPNTPFEFKGAL